MSFTREYEENFNFAGYAVHVEFETLPGEAEAGIRDLIRKNNFGSAQIVLLGAAIKRLQVGDKTIIKPASRAKRRANNSAAQESADNLPALYDRTTWESLTDHLIKIVVKEEFWIAHKEPFATAFAEFIDDEDVPEQDPTPSLAETNGES